MRSLPSVAAYALWAAAYPPTAHNRLMQIEQLAMCSLLPSVTGLDILDLGCGSGRYVLLATQLGTRRIVGLDNSLAMLERGQSGLALNEAIQSELDAIPYRAASFDGIICALAAGHLPEDRMRSVIRESARVLRPGGWLLLSDFHPFLYLNGGKRTFTAVNGQRFAVEHYPHLMADYFAALTAAGLSLEAMREPAASNGQNDLPAVLVFRARK